MARRSSDFGIDDDDIALIAKEMGAATPGVIKRHIIAVVNEAIDEAQSLAVRRIMGKVNLTADYILNHLKVTQRAGPASDTAILSATKRGVLLSRFDARQEWRASRDKRRRSGSRVRGGVSVAVQPGVRINMRSAFLLKLRMSEVTGVAVNPKNQDKLNKREWKEASRLGYAVLHGPSVDQLFRSALDDGDVEPDLDSLAERFLRRVRDV
ncbi:hypothetical protein D3C80_97070 [compost metagenome]